VKLSGPNKNVYQKRDTFMGRYFSGASRTWRPVQQVSVFNFIRGSRQVVQKEDAAEM
jgi:hypothetical protein